MAGKRSKLGSLTSGFRPGGLWPWADFLHGRGFRQVLEQVLPLAQQPEPNRLCRPGPWVSGWDLFRGTKLAHCAQLRIDPLLPEMLGSQAAGQPVELLPLLWAV